MAVIVLHPVGDSHRTHFCVVGQFPRSGLLGTWLFGGIIFLLMRNSDLQSPARLAMTPWFIATVKFDKSHNA
jgi:hypothetical protein